MHASFFTALEFVDGMRCVSSHKTGVIEIVRVEADPDDVPAAARAVHVGFNVLVDGTRNLERSLAVPVGRTHDVEGTVRRFRDAVWWLLEADG